MGHNDRRTTASPAARAMAGSVGGVIEACCLQPMDVVKTRLQLDRAGRYHGGISGTLAQVTREEGLRSLWKGLTPFATHLTLKYGLRMGTNASALRSRETGMLTPARRMLAGFGAGVTEALVIVTPFEVVKIRLQQQRGMVRETLKYKGPEGDGVVLKPQQSMLSGFLAGMFGPCATGPFDVAKTRLMAQGRAAADHTPKYKGMVHCILLTAREEGFPALWKGLLPRLMRIPPGQAIMWAVSDQVIGFLDKRNLLQIAVQ
eukprot:jgi/Chlat1/5058/Chrsp33S08955